MENILQTQEQLEDVFAGLVTQMFRDELDEKQILIAYPENGRPSFKMDEDVIFVSVRTEPDTREMYKHRESTYNGTNFEFSQTSQRTLICSFIAYGPNAEVYLTRINNLIYSSEYKYMLGREHLYLVPERTNGIIRVPEQFNGRWWKRYDLQLCFYNTVQVVSSAEAFADVDIRTEVETNGN